MNWENNFLNLSENLRLNFSQNSKNSTASDSIKASEKRQKLFAAFLLSGLPTKLDEAWKYTSLSDFKNTDWKLSRAFDVGLTSTLTSTPSLELSPAQMQEISKQLPSDFINFVFINGTLNKILSDDSDGLLDVVELSEEDFDFEDKNVEERLLNLSQAFLSKKINLSVAKHRVIDKPIQVVFIQSSADSVYLSEKLNIHLAENAEMKLIINTMSFANSKVGAINLNVNIQLDKSARLTYIQLQNENLDSFHFSQCQLRLNSSAQVMSLVLALGSKLTRNYYDLKFSGENAFAKVDGLGVLDGNQHLDNYTFLKHETGNNQSVQHYKSILSGSAHSVFRGRVLIAPGAQKADVKQLNNNLLLTRTAQADSVPQLEIYADDVKAGHGATFGQLSRDEIFYFLSRGIDQYQAVKMLSCGFAKELIYKVESESIQRYLILALKQKIDQLVQGA